VPEKAIAPAVMSSRNTVRPSATTSRPWKRGSASTAGRSEVGYEVFGLVYGLVARRAAERASPEEIAALVVLQRAVTAAHTPEAVLSTNARFLEALRACAGSPRVSSALRSVNGIVPGNFFAVVPKSIDIQRTGIAKVMKAVKAKDGDAAAETMLAMMRRHGGEVARILADRGVLG